MQLVEEENSFYRLSFDEKTDEYFMEVECGTTAVFTISFKLNSKEIADYKSDKSSIRSLAYKVTDYPNEFYDRKF